MANNLTSIRSLARLHTDRAVQVLQGIMDAPQAPESARIMAANSLLDRGWGKAPQTMAGEDGEGPAKVVLEVSWKSSDVRSS